MLHLGNTFTIVIGQKGCFIVLWFIHMSQTSQLKFWGVKHVMFNRIIHCLESANFEDLLNIVLMLQAITVPPAGPAKKYN